MKIDDNITIDQYLELRMGAQFELPGASQLLII